LSLRVRGIVDVLLSTHRRFVNDRMADGAAGLAFYMLSRSSLCC